MRLPSRCDATKNVEIYMPDMRATTYPGKRPGLGWTGLILPYIVLVFQGMKLYRTHPTSLFLLLRFTAARSRDAITNFICIHKAEKFWCFILLPL